MVKITQKLNPTCTNTDINTNIKTIQYLILIQGQQKMLRLSTLLPSLTLLSGLRLSASGHSAVIAYTNEANFQSALNNQITLVDLDSSELRAFGNSYYLEDSGPSSVFSSLGIDFQFTNARVVSGVRGQLPKDDKDTSIQHGVGFSGNVAFDLLNGSFGVGVWSNFIDGGTIKAYDGYGLSGNLIGTADLNGGSFGGLTSDSVIRSVEITCEFNGDLKCGLFDIQFGDNTSAVPTPPTIFLLGTVLSGLFWSRRKNQTSPRSRN